MKGATISILLKIMYHIDNQILIQKVRRNECTTNEVSKKKIIRDDFHYEPWWLSEYTIVRKSNYLN